MNAWPEHISILIPAYRAVSQLRGLLAELLKMAPPSRILVVDDASFDGTVRLCAERKIDCLSHDVNRGKGAALATGFEHLCSSDCGWIITMDADGQHSPEDLPRFIEATHSTPPPGICIGSRTMRPGTMPPERILSNRLTSGILSLLCGVRVIDSQCGYRLYSTELLKKITITCDRFEMESEIIMKAAFLGFPVTSAPIQTLYFNGPSHISHVSDTFRWVFAVLRVRAQRHRLVPWKTIEAPEDPG